MDLDIKSIKQTIDDAEVVLITAGAGMGVDSGLPDFRGNEGFWKAYPAVAKLELRFEEMANPQWFETEPEFAWAFYGHRLNLYKETMPHRGFELLLDLVKQKKDNYFIYTSNVDGQFQKAGFDSEKIYEIHGSIHHFQCSRDPLHGIWSARDIAIEVDMDSFKVKNLPKCRVCDVVARPNILMFGDWSWKPARSNEQEARFNKWKKSVRTKKIVIIEIGAGTAIPSVRMLSEYMSSINHNATLIRINPRDYSIPTKDDISLACGGLEGLEAILT